MRDEVGRVLLFDQIGERQPGGVGMVHVPAHHQGERAHPGWPEDVGVRGGLRAALQDALVDRSQLVHVVGLVGTAAGVHEGEMARDEQGGLVVRHREGPREDRAGLAVLALAVGEEQGVGRAVAVAEMAGLADETARERGVVRQVGAAFDDEVVGDDPVADPHRSGLVAVHAAVAEPVHAAEDGVVADLHPVQVTGVADDDMIPDASHGRFLRFRIGEDHVVQGLHQFRTVAVHRHHIGDLRGEPVIDEHLAAAGLVEDGDRDAVSEPAGAFRQDQVHVLQDGVVADLVVGDIVGDILDEAVVPDRHVVERRIGEAGVLLQPAGELELPLEAAETHGAGKAHPLDMVHLPFCSRSSKCLPRSMMRPWSITAM